MRFLPHINIPFALLAFALLVAVFHVPAMAANHDKLPKDYWARPLPDQGEAPANRSKVERSLAPEDCGECHTGQYEEWRSSLHAKAFSPGLVGQLITSFAANPGACMRCHAPLDEQLQVFKKALAKGQGHNPAAQGLATAGNSCSGCHLRKHKHFGPPQSDSGNTGQSDPGTSHGGVFRSPDFEDASFCSSCHQFPPSWGTINGKALENTYNEWQDSPQAKKGISCQSCHMPERQHLWRGIHDAKMTSSGLTPTFSSDNNSASFNLTNSGVGHAFPTYITPKVIMRAVRLDANGKAIEKSAVSYVIQRSVSFTGGRWVEAFDNRLMPGKSQAINIKWGNAQRVRMWLDVYPDDYYDHQVYDGLIASLKGEGKKLIVKANAAATSSHYRLFETELQRQQ